MSPRVDLDEVPPHDPVLTLRQRAYCGKCLCDYAKAMDAGTEVKIRYGKFVHWPHCPTGCYDEADPDIMVERFGCDSCNDAMDEFAEYAQGKDWHGSTIITTEWT